MKTLKFGDYEFDLSGEGHVMQARVSGVPADARHEPGLTTRPLTHALRRIAELEAQLSESNEIATKPAVLGTLRDDNLPLDAPDARWLREEDCVYRLGARGYNTDTINVQQAQNSKTPAARVALAERVQALLNRSDAIAEMDDGTQVFLSAWTGGGHEAGAWGEISLRFVKDGGGHYRHYKESK